MDSRPSLFAYVNLQLRTLAICLHLSTLSVRIAKHKDSYKTAVSLSPTNKTLAHNLFWDYDASLVDVPLLLISGEGGGDDWVVTGEQLVEIYEDIPDNKIAARRRSTPHNEVLYKPDGYITAWFMYYLQGDEEAGKAFFGNDPEIVTNELYQDIMINANE